MPFNQSGDQGERPLAPSSSTSLANGQPRPGDPAVQRMAGVTIAIAIIDIVLFAEKRGSFGALFWGALLSLIVLPFFVITLGASVHKYRSTGITKTDIAALLVSAVAVVTCYYLGYLR